MSHRRRKGPDPVPEKVAVRGSPRFWAAAFAASLILLFLLGGAFITALFDLSKVVQAPAGDVSQRDMALVCLSLFAAGSGFGACIPMCIAFGAKYVLGSRVNVAGEEFEEALRQFREGQEKVAEGLRQQRLMERSPPARPAAEETGARETRAAADAAADSRLRERNAALRQVEDRIAAARTTLRQLQENTAQARRECEAANTARREAQEGAERARRDLETVQGRLADDRRQLERLGPKLREEELVTVRLEEKAVQLRLAELEEAQITARLATLQARLTGLANGMAAPLTAIASDQRELEAERERARSDVDDAQQTCARLEGQAAALRTELETLRTQLEACCPEKVQRAAEMLADLNRKVDEAQGALDGLVEQREKCTGEVEALQAELVTLGRRKEAAAKEYGTLVNAVNLLRKTVNGAQQKGSQQVKPPAPQRPRRKKSAGDAAEM